MQAAASACVIWPDCAACLQCTHQLALLLVLPSGCVGALSREIPSARDLPPPHPTSLPGMQGVRLSLTVHTSPGAPPRVEGLSNSANIVAGDLLVCGGVAHAMDAVLIPVPPAHGSSG